MIFNKCRVRISTSADTEKILKTLKKQKNLNNLTALFMGLAAAQMILSELRSYEQSQQISYLNKEIERLKERKEE